MLDLVAAHHVTLVEVLPDARDPAEVLAMSTAASEFLIEVLASFAMATSAYEGVREQLEQARRGSSGCALTSRTATQADRPAAGPARRRRPPVLRV